jgi:hypothetical protein
MAGAETKNQARLAKVTLAVILALVALGLLLHGLSRDVLLRTWHDIAGRPSGPMAFRFVLQPIMAVLMALRDGIVDARTGRSPYFWTVLTNASERQAGLREGFIATARIILLGLGMDAIYQFKVFGTFYPGEALVVALVLACLPYILIRGPADRIARWWLRPSSGAPRS